MKSNNTHKIRHDKDNSCAVISAIFACKIREATQYLFWLNALVLSAVRWTEQTQRKKVCSRWPRAIAAVLTFTETR